MKLIDADKLKTNLWDLYCHYACNGRDLDKAAALNVGLGAVEVQEEIEAIPISWLENCNFTLKLQDTTIPINYIIESLIDIWRNENESNTNT